MSREELKKSGLLDQYVLGLLDTEQSARVEELLGEDPFLQQEVDRLRRDLHAYADSQEIAPPPSGRAPRSPEEFQDLDHEMILAMMEHNHSLNIWRYVMIAACFLLICLSGYLFRLKEFYKSALVTERAVHAQDVASLEADRQEATLPLTAIPHPRVDWNKVDTVYRVVAAGEFRLHVFTEGKLALVDLSDILPPEPGHVYLIQARGGAEAATVQTVRAEDLATLFPVPLRDSTVEISVYRGREGEELPEPLPAGWLIAEVRFPADDLPSR